MRLLGVLRSGDGLSDVAHTQRRPVAIGDDDVVPSLGDGELVVGVDGVTTHLPVDAALGRVDGRDRQLGADILERNVLRNELGRIELDANRRLLFAADRYLTNAGDLADLLGKLGIGIVVDVDQSRASEVTDSSRIGESAGLTLR